MAPPGHTEIPMANKDKAKKLTKRAASKSLKEKRAAKKEKRAGKYA